MIEKIKAIIEENLGYEIGTELTENTSFKDLGLDSLDLFEMVMHLEEEYDMSIAAQDMEKLTTIGAVIDYMNKNGINL